MLVDVCAKDNDILYYGYVLVALFEGELCGCESEIMCLKINTLTQKKKKNPDTIQAPPHPSKDIKMARHFYCILFHKCPVIIVGAEPFYTSLA